jgi:hypothetical protein
MSEAAVVLSACPNCGASLAGAYCASCGQKVTPINPTVHDFLHDLTHELLHVDGKIFRSINLLVRRPGFLTREYFLGRRGQYVSPIRLYLIFSVLYFAALAFTSTMSQVGYTPDPGETIDPRAIEQLRETLNHITNQWVPRAMFVLVPVFGALVMLVNKKTGRNYPQHLYFALHVHAMWFLAGAFAAALKIARIPYLSDSAELLAMLYAAVYLVLALRRAYEMATLSALWRAAVVGVAYVLVVVITIFLLWMPAFATFGSKL